MIDAPRPEVKTIYHGLISEGYDPKSAAKEAQARTGVSVVTGLPITKKIEFSSNGKAVYSGQYPDRTVGKSKQSKPGAWPR